MSPLRKRNKTNKLAAVILQLLKNDEEISFPNRTADNLPPEIKGKALWMDHMDLH
jgi:hypothetical protein